MTICGATSAYGSHADLKRTRFSTYEGETGGCGGRFILPCIYLLAASN
jgi:hypothetical protein